MQLKNPSTSRRERAVAFIAVAVLATVATACGSSGSSSTGTTGGSSQSAAAFVKTVTTQFSRGQAGRLWDTLLPADQAVVSRDRYTACQSNEGFQLQQFKVLETYGDTIDVGGKATSSTAVSVQVTSNDGMTTATMHAVLVGGKWRWILSPTDYATYKRGACPKSG
jgi:hypothetical protein